MKPRTPEEKAAIRRLKTIFSRYIPKKRPKFGLRKALKAKRLHEQGLSFKQISEIMGFAESTVQKHVAELLYK